MPSRTFVAVLREIKPFAEAVLARGGPAHVARALRPRRDCILAYHNVLPDDVAPEGDASLHISRSRFASHLDAICSTCRVVPLADLVPAARSEVGAGRSEDGVAREEDGAGRSEIGPDRSDDGVACSEDGVACSENGETGLEDGEAREAGRGSGRANARASRAPRVAITFDDGYRGALTEGLEELAGRGLPATFFISPALLGDTVFWWDAVRTATGGPLGGMAREVAVEVCRGDQREVLAWARRRGLSIREPHPLARTVTVEELDGVAARPGVTLGSHGWSHTNLAAMDSGTLRSELERPLAWLRERYGTAFPVISYPYGRTSATVGETARRVGYGAGLRVEGGALEPRDPDADGPAGSEEFRTDPRDFEVPRINAPAGLSADGLRLRLAGVLS